MSILLGIAGAAACRRRSLANRLIPLLLVAAGCGPGGSEPGARRGGPVVVYSALDREFAEPLLRGYQERTGVQVLPKFDVESTKTVGLTNLIVAEAGRP